MPLAHISHVLSNSSAIAVGCKSHLWSKTDEMKTMWMVDLVLNILHLLMKMSEMLKPAVWTISNTQNYKSVNYFWAVFVCRTHSRGALGPIRNCNYHCTKNHQKPNNPNKFQHPPPQGVAATKSWVSYAATFSIVTQRSSLQMAICGEEHCMIILKRAVWKTNI